MTAKSFRNFLIESALLHLTMFILVAKMSPATHVTVRAVEAFIIESPTIKASKLKQSIRSGSAIADNRRMPEVAEPHQVTQEAIRIATPPANQTHIEASPSIAAAVSATIKPADKTASTSTSGNTAISQQSAHSKADNPGSISSVHPSQHNGSGLVMTLGEAGSPRFIHKESPIYPFVARKLGKEGKVILRLALNDQGQLQGIDTVESSGFGFAEAASAAIRKSTFAPAMSNGRTISAQVLVPIRFILQEGQ